MDQRALMYFSMWHMRCEILRHATRESCILSAKILCDLYAQIGVQAMPLTVDVIAANRVTVERQAKGEPVDVEDDTDSFAMQCKVIPGGGDPESDFWNGHLVVLADGRYICDPSADQFARPERGILALPSMFAFEEEDRIDLWLHGEQDRAGVRLEEGGMLAYEAHPEEVSYRASPDWTETKAGEGLWESVMSKVHGLIGIYEDVEELPQLPALPPSRSAKEPLSDEDLARSLASMQELGYTVKDLTEREEAEARRKLKARSGDVAKKAAEL